MALSVCSYVHSVIHNRCGQDIPRNMQPMLLKLRMYTLLYGKRKKAIYFHVKRSRSLGLYKEFQHLDPCG